MIQAGDIDGDGDWDVLAGENGDHVTWNEFVLKDDGLYNGLLHDVNNDGKLDVCGAPGHEGDPYFIWINTMN